MTSLQNPHSRGGDRRCCRKFMFTPDPSFSPFARLHDMMSSIELPMIKRSVILNPWMPLMFERLTGEVTGKEAISNSENDMGSDYGSGLEPISMESKVYVTTHDLCMV